MTGTVREHFAGLLRKCPIIAILRGVTPVNSIDVTGVLLDSGIRLVEIALNSPDAVNSIAGIVRRFQSDDALFGAGTVLSEAAVRQVADAGGRFVISPNTRVAVIRQTKDMNLISIPGFYSPSEAFQAVEAGADYLKCFPVRSLGPSYIKDLKAVLPHPMIAVGGVTLSNISEYLKVCEGVGIGSELYSTAKPIDALRKAAVSFVTALSSMPPQPH